MEPFGYLIIFAVLALVNHLMQKLSQKVKEAEERTKREQAANRQGAPGQPAHVPTPARQPDPRAAREASQRAARQVAEQRARERAERLARTGQRDAGETAVERAARELRERLARTDDRKAAAEAAKRRAAQEREDRLARAGSSAAAEAAKQRAAREAAARQAAREGDRLVTREAAELRAEIESLEGRSMEEPRELREWRERARRAQEHAAAGAGRHRAKAVRALVQGPQNLQRALVIMTVMGPCRAQDPHDVGR